MEAPPVTRADVEAAAARIEGWVRRTPVVDLEEGAFGVPGQVALKLELLQHTGSFKARGAFNQVLTVDAPEAGVVAASGGNFALAAAHAAGELGHRVTIFVPESSPAAKVERLRETAAEVHVTGAFYAEALEASRVHARETGALELHAFDNPEMVAGGGTCALELDSQAPGLDTVLVAVGGGGLIAGTAAWYGEGAKIVAVEPEGCPSLASALEAGEPVEVEIGGVASDSLGARRVGEIPFAIAREHVDESLLISDDAIVSAQHVLWRELRVVAEPGGAAALGALLAKAYVPEAGERVGVFVCGGNTDPASVV